MKTSLVALALVAVVGVGAVFVFGGSGDDAASESGSQPAPAERGEIRVERDRGDAASSPSSVDVARDASGPATGEASMSPVAGHVLGPDGSAIGGARVTLRRLTTAWPEESSVELETAYSGPDGTFRFRTARGHGLVVEVMHEGYERRAETAHASVADLSLHLRVGFQMRGTVVDEIGRPVPGAEVILEPMTYGFRRAVATKSDANGQFLFENLAGGLARLTARIPENVRLLQPRMFYHPATLPKVSVGSDEFVRLRFETAKSLMQPLLGEVRRAEGTGERVPVEGAEVRLYPTAAYNWGLYVPIVTHTDRRGRFRVTSPGTGNIRVEVRHPELSTETRVLAMGRSAAVQMFELVERTEVRGRLRGAAAGLDLALVSAIGEIGRTRVAADGSFAFDRRFSVGWAELEVVRGRAAFARTSSRFLDLQLEDGPLNAIDLELVAPSVLTGRVLDEDGAPISGVIVSTPRRRLLTVNTPERIVAQTDADGRYALVGLPSGSAELVFDHDEHAQAKRAVPNAQPGETKQVEDVTLETFGSLRGLVTRGGDPLPGAVVFAGRGMRTDAHVVTGPDGKFVLPGLAPGRYRLRAAYSTLPIAAAAESTEVASGAVAGPVEIEFAVGRVVRGQVVDRRGLPVPDALVMVAGRQAPPMSTDSLGRFALEVPEGDIELLVVDSNLQVEAREPIDGGQDRTTIRLMLVSRAELTGRALGLPDRKPLNGGFLRFTSLDSDSGDATVERQRSVTGVWVAMSGGSFRIDRFPVGRSRVVLQCPGYAPWISEVEVARDRIHDLGTILLEPGASIRGVVTNGDGRPVVGASVHLGHVDDLQQYGVRLANSTDVNGKFALRGIGPDARQVVVFAEGYFPATVELTLPDDLLRSDPVPIALEPASHLDVRVVDGGKAVPELVQIMLLKDGVMREARVSDEKGELRFEARGPGRYVVRLLGQADVHRVVEVVGGGESHEVVLDLAESRR